MAGYVWMIIGLVVAAGLFLAWRYDRRMKAQGRNVRSSGDMVRDGRNAKSDARAFTDRSGAPTSAAHFATNIRKERQGERDREEPR